ncbi:undecaprenyl-diphosphatase [Sinobaca qinghaiensis]|uniref:Undecaprenyl-diphosphatase n=1 Tax=Sinobaca qinghaiensis TaxID=342944 RepID=A0A419V378_9BACL|nr:phosphatase PAP2 family protein [Sinobaca qinghaiensis]RKD72924.1 undecaprenyl-diphosphatase [Sinobaca qinghaiensis]
MIEKKWIVFICLSGIAAFIILAQDVAGGTSTAWEQSIIDAVRIWTNPFMIEVFKFITSLASVIFTTALTTFLTILFWVRKKWKKGWIVAIAVGGSGAINFALKSYFYRDRPSVNQLIEADGYSFPSGHAMNALVMYGMIALILVLAVENAGVKAAVIAASALLIVLIGLSRIYLGVHYPGDVMGGFIVASMWLLITGSWYIKTHLGEPLPESRLRTNN